MKFSVNVLTGGRYYQAFEDDVPDSVIPEHFRRYAITNEDQGDDRSKSRARPFTGSKGSTKPRKGSKG